MSSRATYGVDTISKLLLLTPRRIQQLVREGVLPRSERGRYELVPVVQAYVGYRLRYSARRYGRHNISFGEELTAGFNWTGIYPRLLTCCVGYTLTDSR